QSLRPPDKSRRCRAVCDHRDIAVGARLVLGSTVPDHAVNVGGYQDALVIIHVEVTGAHEEDVAVDSHRDVTVYAGRVAGVVRAPGAGEERAAPAPRVNRNVIAGRHGDEGISDTPGILVPFPFRSVRQISSMPD